MSYRTTSLDFYDDQGALLKRNSPERGDLPPFVKEARATSQDDHPDQFALVMVEKGNVLKKFATADAGNTWLSAIYFSENRHKLPEEAQKVAAANLAEACAHYGIDLLKGESEVPAESNIVDMDGLLPPIQKVASVKTDIEYAIERADGTKTYPLDNADSLAAASKYFSLNHGSFQPRERREFSVKVASVSNRFGLPVSEEIEKYAGADYSLGVDEQLAVRYHILREQDSPLAEREALMKLAQEMYSVEAETFADLLSSFDESTGLDRLWDKDIADPYAATFGMSKIAKGDEPAPATFTVGTKTVTTDALGALAREPAQVKEHFGVAVSTAFAKNPVAIFQSMPTPQKLVMANLANSVLDSATY